MKYANRIVLCLGIVASMPGCCDNPVPPPEGCETTDAGRIRPVEPRNPEPATYDKFAARRQSCEFGPGMTTLQTIGPDVPHGNALPFDHVLVLLLENRSFDHYFSGLKAFYPEADVATAAHTSIDPSPTNGVREIAPFHETRYCVDDLNHEWTAVHLQYDRGAMDGFVATNEPDGDWTMGYYDQTDLPYYYWLATTFATSDRHFSSLLGPTWPNRFFFFGATAWGRTFTPSESDFRKLDVPAGGQTLFDQLDDRGVSWRIYYASAWPPLTFPMLGRGLPFSDSASPISDLEADVQADALPAFSFIEPNFRGAGRNDEHPPVNMQLGQQFVQQVVAALRSNPKVWAKTVLFITHDEHGGYYDHVPPPAACEPDDLRPPDFAFDRYGMRVPLMVVSPLAKQHYMSHYITDLTSITRFVQNRFDLGAMTMRDANAWPLLDLFNFRDPPAPPPTGEPSAVPSPEHLAQCADTSIPRRGMPQ